MELSLNELSINPVSSDKYEANKRMTLFAKTTAEARKRGIRKIRSDYSASEIGLTLDYSFKDWMFDKDFPFELRSLFYDMLIQPFIDEEKEEVENKYIEKNYFHEDLENELSKQQCVGLTAAFLSNNLTISFDSSSAWRKNIINIIVEDGDKSSVEEVCNVFSKECFDQEPIANFLEEVTPIALRETEINPNEKKLHLTSHHGQKELKDLWDKLKHSTYVESAISIEWGGNTFYKNPQENGKVDIVHLNSDRRYVLQIQTTGCNLRETTEIAELLEKKYK